MLLKKLKLHNIRTYADEEIIFPESSLMLSGDIGSGKSSILIAIEFALFGILRGELSGESLLRKGCNEGGVELTFDEITIKRNLKKTPKGVQQEYGYIIENGEKSEGTAVELKAKILDILNYPKSLLNDSKSLIYRYTVYTPQEEMKRIIQDDEEIRLNILRKVFNIDKYKRIKENANILLASLREELMISQAKLEQLPIKEMEKSEFEKNLSSVISEIASMITVEEVIRKDKKKKLEEINAVEEQIKELNVLKQQFYVEENNFRNLISKLSSNSERILLLKKKHETLSEELSEVNPEDENELKLRIEAMMKSISVLEQREREVIARTLSLKDKISDSEKLKEKISTLKNCPMCLQPVNEEHKKHVRLEEQKKIESAMVELNDLSKEKPDVNEKKEKLDTFRRALSKIELINFKKKTLAESSQLISELENENESLKVKITESENNKKTLKQRIDLFAETEAAHSKLKNEYESIVEREKIFYGRMSEMKARKENSLVMLKKLEEEVKYLKELSSALTKKIGLRNWLKDHFLNLVDLIERHVMVKIHQEFNEYFQEWFSFMLEDENMSARVDDKFSPLVEQNGYEISFNDLSGGEKTSVALAYRLALNKVINDLISAINTKDILVLDEPTDGFSSEQLDKLKDVIEQLDMKQVIIVSHESKVESFVSNVIRIAKSDGISRVVG